MSSSLVFAVNMMIGCARSTLRHLVADREAVAARQHHVEEQQVEASAERLREALLAVRDRIDVEAVENEHVREPGADRGFVLDDEYSRLALLHSRRAARQGSVRCALG